MEIMEKKYQQKTEQPIFSIKLTFDQNICDV